MSFEDIQSDWNKGSVDFTSSLECDASPCVSERTLAIRAKRARMQQKHACKTPNPGTTHNTPPVQAF